jgi:hypothetical protein
MRKVFTEILPRGILPALSQPISRASELGIFENQGCLGCLRYDVPKLDLNYFVLLSQTLPMFTHLSTGMVESVLLGRVQELSRRYVFVFGF